VARESGAGSGSFADSYQVAQTDQLPFQIHGLAPGAYLIRATQRPSKVSKEVSFSLKIGETAKVALGLGENLATFVIRAPDGTPIETATLSGGGEQSSPGVYSLRRIPPGTALIIVAPEFVPICRLAPGAGEHDVRLAQGRTVDIEFVGSIGSYPPGSVSWPGSECAVPLSSFRSQFLAKAAGSQVFRVADFPVLNSITYTLRPLPDVQLSVPASGLVQVNIRGKQ
jgi:hypothetical protein